MKKLVRYTHYFLAISVLGAAVFVAIIFMQPPNWKLSATVALVGTLIAAFLLGKLRKNISTARLIIDNQILHIQPAVFQEMRKEKTGDLLPGETIEVFVSCFGILLDSKIIKFNQEGVRLKAVELGGDYISLTYGMGQKTRSTKLLHEKLSDDALVKIARKFRYETGIMPTITF